MAPAPAGQSSSAAKIKILTAAGWVHVATVGSHWQFRHPARPGKVTVPHPRKDLLTATVKSILKQAGMN